jgi:hypothetical protein
MFTRKPQAKTPIAAKLAAEWLARLEVETKSKASIVERLTLQQQLERFIDFASQCYVRSGTRLIPFTPLYDYQVELVRIALTYRGIVLLKTASWDVPRC